MKVVDGVATPLLDAQGKLVKSPEKPDTSFEDEQMKAANAIEKEYSDYYANRVSTEGIIKNTERWSQMLSSGGSIPPQEIGTIINGLYRIAKSRDPRTGVRMPEIALDREYLSKLDQFYYMLDQFSRVPLNAQMVESLRLAAMDLNQSDKAVIDQAKERKIKTLESIRGRAATGLRKVWDYEMPASGASTAPNLAPTAPASPAAPMPASGTPKFTPQRILNLL